MAPVITDACALSRPAFLADDAGASAALMIYWYGNDFRAGVPATLIR